ncbi:hypothetical protein PVAND_014891 [Polypedilum vanderplanki]|uniref:Very long-chain specific acyl-CoA dehydrogenase, mitochondrial n=1 Tax=Polypedilum vanderplanki TaxID=319348 RepID=A0A9J6BAP0_POLVA|nr:hypothetical protein PVAND_014891 [Polypedilum vanderplanki]
MFRVTRIGVLSKFKKCNSNVHQKCSLYTTIKVHQSETNKNTVEKNSSFVHNIFRGQIESSQVFPFPMALNEEQLENTSAFIDPMTKFFTQVNNADKNDANEIIDPEVVKHLSETGAFGLQVPLEYGGLGLNNTQYGRMGEIIGMYDLGLSIFIGAHQSIGFKGILLYGTKEQKAKYLPKLSSGENITAFALTEPSAGSDAASIKSRAVKSADGKHYILNGSKIWISNGGIAEIMTVFARTEVVDEKTGQKKDKITAFIVERAFGGVSNGPPEKKLGIKCSNTAEVYFEDVKIPIENVLGGEGNGFKVAMNILNNGRFGMGMALGGTMRMSIQKATEHATQRVQFGRKLETYGSIQEKLARMSTVHYVNQSIAYMISSNMDLGSNDYHLEAAISKVFASEGAWYVCDEAIQILGGMGFMRSTGLERFLRDLRIFRIFEGANDILRLFIALTGIQYAGSHLKQVQKALKNPIGNFGIILKEASKRAGSFINLGSDGMTITNYVDASLLPSAKLCGESIDMFSRSVDKLLIKYGKGIIDEQFLLNRLADSAIDIYAMACALSRCSRSMKFKLPSVEIEKLMTESWCLEASDRVRVNLRKIHSSDFHENYKRMTKISENVCKVKDIVHNNPIEFFNFDFTNNQNFDAIEIFDCENSSKTLEIIQNEKFQNDFKELKKVTTFLFNIHGDLDKIKGGKFNTNILNFQRPLVVAFVQENNKVFEIFWKTKNSNFHNISISNSFRNWSAINFMNVIEFFIKFLKNEVSNSRSAISPYYASETDDTITHCLTELVDSFNDNLLLVSIKYDNMDAYNFLKTPSFDELMVYKKGKAVTTSTIDLAFSKENVKLFHDLLQKEMKFPKLFKQKREIFEEQCPELKELVENFEQMHKFVDEINDEEDCEKLWNLLIGKNDDKISSDDPLRIFYGLLKKHYGKKYCYNTKNISLLKHAKNLRKEKLYNLLIELKMKYSSNDDENNNIKAEHVDSNFSSAMKLKGDHITQLLNSSRLKIDENALTCEHRKTLRKIFDYLDTIEFIKPILMIIAACSNFLILFDTDSDDVTRTLMEGFQGTLGAAFFKKGRLIVGAKSLFNSETMKVICDKKFNFETLKVEVARSIGTLVHELCHYAMYLIFKNDCRPYLGDFNSKFDGIVKNLNTSRINLKNDDEKRIIGAVFTHYKNTAWHAEAIVRVPQIYAEFSHINVRLNELRETFKELFEFYEKNLLEIVKVSVETIEKVNKKSVKFSDLDEHWKEVTRKSEINFHENDLKLSYLIRE